MHNNILIVTYNWPPRNSIGTNRPYLFAKYLQSDIRFDKIAVLTCAKSKYDEPLDSDLGLLERVEIIELPLVKKTSRNNIIFSFLKKIKKRFSFLKMIPYDQRDVFLKYFLNSDIYKNDFLKEYNIIFSTFGPRSCHLIASEIKSKYPSATWVADYRDLWSLHHRRYLGLNAYIQRKKEILCLNNADIVSTINLILANKLSKFLKKKSLIYSNGHNVNSSKEEISNSIANSNYTDHAKEPINIVYGGTIHYPFQNPIPLITYFSECQFTFFGSLNKLFLNEISSINNTNFVIKGHVSKGNLFEFYRKYASFLLVLDDFSSEGDGNMTGKIFELILVGKPIICYGNKINGPLSDLIQNSNVGIYSDSFDEINKFITSFDYIKFLSKIDFEYIDKFSFNTLSKNFVDEILYFKK